MSHPFLSGAPSTGSSYGNLDPSQHHPYYPPANSVQSSSLNLDPKIDQEFTPKSGTYAYIQEESWVRFRISSKRLYKSRLQQFLSDKTKDETVAQTQKLIQEIGEGVRPPVQGAGLQLNPVDLRVGGQPAVAESVDVRGVMGALQQLEAFARAN